MCLDNSQMISTTLLFLIAIAGPSCSPSATEPTLGNFPTTIILPSNSSIPTSTVLECKIDISSLPESAVALTDDAQWQTPNGQMVNASNAEGSKFSVESAKLYSDSYLVSHLNVDRLVYTDAGMYTCMVEGTPKNKSVQLILLTSLYAQLTIMESDNRGSAELSCEMSDYIQPNNHLRWYKDDQELEVNDRRRSLSFRQGSMGTAQYGGVNNTYSTVSVLMINDLVEADSGTYSCRVNDPNSRAVLSAQLTVDSGAIVMVTPSDFSPLPTVNPQDITITLVATVTGLAILSTIITVLVLVGLCFIKRKITHREAKNVQTSPNVSYGAEVRLERQYEDLPTRAIDDPLYESIGNVQYCVAYTPNDEVEYYVNEGLGPE